MRLRVVKTTLVGKGFKQPRWTLTYTRPWSPPLRVWSMPRGRRRSA